MFEFSHTHSPHHSKPPQKAQNVVIQESKICASFLRGLVPNNQGQKTTRMPQNKRVHAILYMFFSSKRSVAMNRNLKSSFEIKVGGNDMSRDRHVYVQSKAKADVILQEFLKLFCWWIFLVLEAYFEILFTFDHDHELFSYDLNLLNLIIETNEVQ